VTVEFVWELWERVYERKCPGVSRTPGSTGLEASLSCEHESSSFLFWEYERDGCCAGFRPRTGSGF